jgi:hypothetical protein
MEMTDVLGWITFRRPVWHRTFYVYPRVVDVEYPYGIGRSSDLSTGPSPGASQDYALFETLVSYRPGQSVRHMDWKKFMAVGEPFLKSYARTSQPGITFYLDLRRFEEPSPRVLEREDCSVEILVALVKFFLDRSVPVSVHAMGQSRYLFHGSDPADFPRFHKDTVNIFFTDTISPADLYRSDSHSSSTFASVAFISHEIDPGVLAIVEDAVATEQVDDVSVTAIINETNMQPEVRLRSKAYFESVREKGGQIVVVGSPNSIAEDLTA